MDVVVLVCELFDVVGLYLSYKIPLVTARPSPAKNIRVIIGTTGLGFLRGTL